MSINVDALNQIKNILGYGGFLDEPAAMAPHLTAWRGGWSGLSPLIALPTTTQQVASIVSICAQHRIGIVPQGGNTGTVGGCIPSKQNTEIVINLSRMNKIRDLDPVGAIVTAEAGVILQDLQDAAAKAGFQFPLSLAAQGSAQIGGNISTNAGGINVLRYGNMANLVLGIEAVLANGQIISGLKKLGKDNTGYHLAQYFVGAEGTLGIVTAATLRLFPELRQKLVAVLAIHSADTALHMLAEFRAEATEYLNAFEIISHAALERVVHNIAGTRFPGKPDAPFYLLIELGSASDIVPLRDMFENVAGLALESGVILDAVIAENLSQTKQFWHLRENISEALRKESAVIHFDIALPLAQIAEFLRDIEPRVKAVAPDIIPAPFGHIGDGNIHYNMYFPRKPDNFSALKKQIQEIVYSSVQARQGSISAEHGIGTDRRDDMKYSKSPAEIEMMKTVKRALDPDNLMNPGKIF